MGFQNQNIYANDATANDDAKYDANDAVSANGLPERGSNGQHDAWDGRNGYAGRRFQPESVHGKHYEPSHEPWNEPRPWKPHGRHALPFSTICISSSNG